MSFFDGDIRDFSYPDFGKSDTPREEWQEFYSFFTAYVTTRLSYVYTFREKILDLTEIF